MYVTKPRILFLRCITELISIQGINPRKTLKNIPTINVGHGLGTPIYNSIRHFCYRPPREWVLPFTDLSEQVESRQDVEPSHWVKKVCQIICSAPSDSLAESLDEFCYKAYIRLATESVEYILRLPEVLASPDTAYIFFKWAGTQKRYKHSLNCYVSIIDSLGSAKDIERIHIVYKELKENLPTLNVNAKCCRTLIKNFGRTGMVDEALDIWHAMKEKDIAPEVFTYNSLINSLVNASCIKEAEKVLETMKDKVGVAPSIVSYNMIIKGLCKVGRLDSAMEYFSELKNVKDPDQVSYVTLMQAFHAAKRYDRNLSLFIEMVEKRFKIIPHAYNLVISGLCKEGRVMEGYRIMRKMRKGGCQPNLITYTPLVNGFFRIGNKALALEMVNEIIEKGFGMDNFTFSIVINGLCKVGEVKKAQDFFHQFSELDLKVNAFSYCALIDGLAKSGKIKEAEKLFAEMPSRGCARDAHCYNSFIDGLCKAQEMSRAKAVFDNMVKEGCQPSVYTYSILVDGFFLANKPKEAFQMWDEMIKQGVAPSAASFRILSKGICLSGNVNRACKILDEMTGMGVISDVVYTDMATFLVKDGCLELACKLADRLVEKGQGAPAKIRNRMIDALKKSGNRNLARRLEESNIGVGYTACGREKKRVPFSRLLEYDTQEKKG